MIGAIVGYIVGSWFEFHSRKSQELALLLAVMAVGWAVVTLAVETEPCERWDDVGTNLALPEEIAGMRMQTRNVYGENDQTFVYGSREFVTRTVGKRFLSFDIYKGDRANLEADGVSDDVRIELACFVKAVELRQHEGNTNVVMCKNQVLGKIGTTDCVAAEFTYRDAKLGADMRGWALSSTFAGRFIRLCYYECVTDAGGKARPSSWPKVVMEVGLLMDRAKRDRAVDVYAVTDATNRLAAIRRKWVGAGNRVSMWKLPNYGEKFLKIGRVHDWYNGDPVERYPIFEQCVREAIDLRVDLPYWYYNLSCALAVQGKKEDAFEALEQAVASGYGAEGKANHVRQDRDLASLTNDMRFAALCDAMDADERRAAAAPQQFAEEKDGFVRLSDKNVYFALSDALYTVHLLTSNECPVVYVNHHENHPDIPCDGLINVIYPKEAHEERRDIAYADMYFLNYDRSHRLNDMSCCPTVVASNWTYGDDWLNGSTSIPAGYGLNSVNVGRECKLLLERNVLGVYAASSDYWVDGVDRFMGWYPGCIAYAGGPEEADKFVALFRDIVRALPKELRVNAALLALNLIRHGQKCVKTEADFMSGKAQRPVLRFADIDVKKVLAAAAKMLPEASWPISPFLNKEKTLAMSGLAVTDLRDWPLSADCSCHAMSAYYAAFFARGGERTFRSAVACHPVKRGKLAWKVLQGDEKKVRILPKAEDMSEIELEVDYHTVFDVTLADGTRQKTSRVDVGCFLVGENGVASVPAIVSVYFSPNETREYGKDGRLISIDYTKRQIEQYCPSLYPMGDWKDAFHWTDDGRLLGWTRTYADGQGHVTTNEFTRDGLVIDTRDALGRPKDVHRSLRSKWLQELSPTNMTKEAESKLGWFGHRYDYEKGNLCETTLAWQYTYKDETDRFGHPSPKEAKPFTYRPELCRRADFFDSSTGFSLPFLDQVGFGYEIYASYKHDIVGQFPNDFRREDSAFALKDEGLVPSKPLKRMKFCKWTPSTNDIWKVETDLAQLLKEKTLWELADGSCRFENTSVNATYRILNLVSEVNAYKALDRNYRRCKANEVKKLFATASDEDWTDYLIVEGKYVFDEKLPVETKRTMTVWQIADDIYFCIDANRQDGACFRKYQFRTEDKDTGELLGTYSFSDLPSLVIGNTVVAAERGDPTAINNLAVLMYSEIINLGEYNEETVTIILEAAARMGNAMATYNLGVMAENRGEKSLAARRYDEARAMNERDKARDL